MLSQTICPYLLRSKNIQQAPPLINGFLPPAPHSYPLPDLFHFLPRCSSKMNPLDQLPKTDATWAPPLAPYCKEALQLNKQQLTDPHYLSGSGPLEAGWALWSPLSTLLHLRWSGTAFRHHLNPQRNSEGVERKPLAGRVFIQSHLYLYDRGFWPSQRSGDGQINTWAKHTDKSMIIAPRRGQQVTKTQTIFDQSN